MTRYRPIHVLTALGMFGAPAVSSAAPSDACGVEFIGRGDPGDQFGSSVAIDDGTLVIGAMNEVPPLDATGAVYIYEHDGHAWVHTQRLDPTDTPDPIRSMGAAVDIEGDRLAVGAPISNHVAIFERHEGRWALDELIAIDDASTVNFGFAVALDGDVLIVSDPFYGTAPMLFVGRVHVFRRGSEGWIEEARFDPPVAAGGRAFGFGIATNGTEFVVGSFFDGQKFGLEAYAFDNGTWVHRQTITAIGPESSVAMRGTRLVAATKVAGAAAVTYLRDERGWTVEQVIPPVPGIAAACDQRLVALTDTRLAIGHGNAFDAEGLVAVYELHDGTWVALDRVPSLTAHEFDYFGHVLALDDQYLVAAPDACVGTIGCSATCSGEAVDVFPVTGLACPDGNNDCEVDVIDLLKVLSHWGQDASEVTLHPHDHDLDGVVGIGDLLMVLAAWGPCG